MIATKTPTTGIDTPIQAMQKFLYTNLLRIWGLAGSDYKAYGRVYRNQTEDGYIPEAFTGIGNNPKNPEYTDAMFDDTVKAVSFFGVDEDEDFDTGSSTAKVFIIFMVNVPKLKPTFITRADEEIREDVKRLIFSHRYGFTMTGTVTGIDSVFREYSGWKKEDGIKYRDTHPWHCFRINTNLLYSILNCSSK